MIKYLGSKRKLTGLILEAVSSYPNAKRVLDLFSGTSRVGHALKGAGFQVFANDHNAYAHTLAQCYVQADSESYAEPAQKWIDELNQIPGKAGWFTATYCEEARFFHPKNGARIEAIRQKIADEDFPPLLRAILLVSLMEAADRVDSTCGVQMAYLKSWAARAHSDLNMRLPDLLPTASPGPGQAFHLEAKEAAKLEADVAYLDPPYNQHSYLSNYHVWESLVQWDHPEVYGRAQKRIDCQTRKSPFNSRRTFRDAFDEVLQALAAPNWVISFSDEGFLARPEMEKLLAKYGEVTVIAQDYKRYVGAQIGQHNLQGERVGEISHLYNTEFLYLVRR